MSNYKKLDNFDICWAKELKFTQIRNTLIFIKNTMDPNASIKPCVSYEVFIGLGNLATRKKNRMNAVSYITSAKDE